MIIKITLFALLRKYAPLDLKEGDSFPLEINDNCNIRQLVKILKIPNNTIRIIMINGEIINNFNYKLEPNDSVSIIPPIGGGIQIDPYILDSINFKYY